MRNYRSAPTPRPCAECSTSFAPSNYRLDRGQGVYCSRRCGILARARGSRSEENQRDRFWSKVDKSRGDACWPWIASVRKDGYGQIHVAGRSGGARGAHKVAWQLTHGPLPAGACVCHRCDNPRCCNPAHLFIGTHGDNSRDMVNKGRSTAGERSASHKLTDAECSAIRARVAGGEKCNAIARERGLSPSTISRIVTGERRRNSLRKSA